MKKIIFIVLLSLFPFFVKADYSISNYKIDITILENGDVNVTEAFAMTGVYNGFERIINYKDNYSGYRGIRLSSIDNTGLYNADGVYLNEIRSVNFTSDFDNILLNSNLFIKSNSATKGEYGVYILEKNDNTEVYRIYNPSKMNKDFYINYTLKNCVIMHEDVAELAMDIFKSIKEPIDVFDIYIHIPSNNDLLKFWLHSQSNNFNEIVDNQTIKVRLTNVNKPFDFRIVFDKLAIKEVNKMSNEIVLDKIIGIENKFAIDEANKDEKYEKIKEEVYNSFLKVKKSKKVEDYQETIKLVHKLKDDDFKVNLLVKLINIESKVERKFIITKIVSTSILGIIIVGLLIIFYQIYKKYCKNSISLDLDFYKDIPYDYSPAVISYLMKRKIKKDDLYNSILYLISNDCISFKPTKDKDYKFKKLYTDNLSKSSERLIKLIFDNSDEVTLSEIKMRAKNSHNNFINYYSNWLNSVIEESSLYKFYEDLLFFKLFGISYSLIGIVICALLLNSPTYFSPITVIVTCCISLIYFIYFHKRTTIGDEHYNKWQKFKKYLKNLDDKNINNWDRYLVYSYTLGCFNDFYKNIKLLVSKNSAKNLKVVFSKVENLINYKKIIESSFATSLSMAYSVKKTN